tara:strand:- start:5533 stop:5862 length:330 start_codon:yes stop_codon:yes gene_type:complete
MEETYEEYKAKKAEVRTEFEKLFSEEGMEKLCRLEEFLLNELRINEDNILIKSAYDHNQEMLKPLIQKKEVLDEKMRKLDRGMREVASKTMKETEEKYKKLKEEYGTSR